MLVPVKRLRGQGVRGGGMGRHIIMRGNEPLTPYLGNGTFAWGSGAIFSLARVRPALRFDMIFPRMADMLEE